MLFKLILYNFIIFSGGVFVGMAAAAIFSLLDIIPRLSQISDTYKYIRIYSKTTILSMSSITLLHFIRLQLKLNTFLLLPIGLISGAFIGLLASSLAEVINVMPVLIKRLNLYDYIAYVVLTIAAGKIVGSLFSWFVLPNYK